LHAIDTEEQPELVRVTVRERTPNGVVTSAGVSRQAQVALQTALGTRAVVDGATGQHPARTRR
jgi:hypothetical protein